MNDEDELDIAARRSWQGSVQLVAFVACVAALAWSHLAFLIALAVLVMVLPPRVRWRPAKVLAVVACYVPFALIWAVFLVGYLWGMQALQFDVPLQPTLEEFAERGLASSNDWIQLVFVVLLVPVIEEILYRGYLFTGLDAFLPRIATHLVTAAVFGIAHGLPYALPIGVLSLLFGWLRARHDALLPAVLAHAVHNGVTVGLVLFWPEHLDLLFTR